MSTFSISREIENLEEDLKDFKNKTSDTFNSVSQSIKSNWVTYLWFIVPIVLIAILLSFLLFSKPKLIRKGKKINFNKFFLYSFFIILSIVAITGLAYWFTHKNK